MVFLAVPLAVPVAVLLVPSVVPLVPLVLLVPSVPSVPLAPLVVPPVDLLLLLPLLALLARLRLPFIYLRAKTIVMDQWLPFRSTRFPRESFNSKFSIFSVVLPTSMWS